MIRDAHPGSGSWFFTLPGSRIQGSKRHRIPDPDPQHCFERCFTARKEARTWNGYLPHTYWRILLNPYPDPGCCWIRIQSGSTPRFLLARKNCGSKTVIYVFLNSYKGHTGQAPGEASSPTENSSDMKFFHFVLFLEKILACLDPDPLTHLNPDPVRIRNCSQAIVRISENIPLFITGTCKLFLK